MSSIKRMTTQRSSHTALSNPASGHRRAVALLATATAIGSLGLAAGGIGAALLAVAMTGTEAAAGVPLGALAAGQAGSALLIGRRSGRAGRAEGLILGYGLGILGALVVIGATRSSSFALMLVGSVLLGGANAGIFLTRYAAAEVGGPAARGRALGTVLFASTVGTIAGPGLLLPSGRLAAALGLEPLTGLYLLAVVAFAGAAAMIAGLSRSRVPDLGRTSRFAIPAVAPRGGAASRRLGAALRLPAVRLALVVLGATNLVMIALMAVSPVMLAHHGHALGFVGLAVSAHVLGMFAPSPLTGWLADRAGGAAVATAGAVLVVAAGAGGMLVDPANGAAMLAVLLVLGLSWNCGVVGGSAMLAAGVPAELRPNSEAIGEASMGFGAAVGAPAAGLLAALSGFAALCLAVAGVGAGMAALTRIRSRHPRAPVPRTW